jgi:glycosyltransferase involved in cell wall biosynthesis
MAMKPLVSVRVATYNHEKYIAQCIEGILMQKTDFPFEVIIGEDCSTDRTREIVLSYQKKYPDKIKVLLPEKNLGPAQNSLQIQQACQGKYHAMCEGDDYWIDPLKLQKQVDFMEAHPDFSLCFHNAFILGESAATARLFFESEVKEILEFTDLCHLTVPTASVLARSEILATLPEWRLKIWCGDVLFRLWCAHHGSVRYLSDIMTVRRFHSGGMVAALGSRLEKSHSEAMYLYRQLDKETNYLHTIAIQAQIKRVEEKYRRDSQGKFYYLMNPARIVTRLQEYYRIVKRHDTIEYIGNPQWQSH